MRTLRDAVSTLETPGQFAAWLDGFGANAIVGYTKEAWGCPLSNYLEQHGAPLHTQVYPDLSDLWGTDDWRDAPWEAKAGDNMDRLDASCRLAPWAGRFAEAVDMSADYAGTPVTAAQARALLAQVALEMTAEAANATTAPEGVVNSLERAQATV